MKEKFLKILPYSGYVLFLSLGLLLFFVSAFLVVVVRTKDEQKLTMPSVIGKNYVEVHNELQRLQLKVRLETLRIPEKTDGIILAQSIDAGKEVEAGSKIYLTVNIGFDRVTIPDLKGQDLKRAKAILEKVLSGEVYVPVSIGGVTYVPSVGDEPPDTVIEQIPHAGKETHSGEKIYLLVTEGTSEKKSSLLDGNKNLEKDLTFIPTPFAIDVLQRKKIPYRITEIKKAEIRENSGLTESVKMTNTGAEIVSFLHKAEEKLNNIYETVSYTIDDDDVYSAVLTYKDPTNESELKKEILTSQPLKEDDKLNLLFYRNKDVTLSLIGNQTGEAKVWKFKGKY